MTPALWFPRDPSSSVLLFPSVCQSSWWESRPCRWSWTAFTPVPSFPLCGYPAIGSSPLPPPNQFQLFSSSLSGDHSSPALQPGSCPSPADSSLLCFNSPTPLIFSSCSINLSTLLPPTKALLRPFLSLSNLTAPHYSLLMCDPLPYLLHIPQPNALQCCPDNSMETAFPKVIILGAITV